MDVGAGQDGLVEGTVFAGDYRVVRPLAAGGMGAVYVVHQISTGKDRALKLMRPEVAADADARPRFELEAKVGAKIESDHVVEVQAAGVDAKTGLPYLVMELLDGEDLMSRVTAKGPLNVGEAREVFEQLCHAVAAAHRAGIVHRDLKPENVFLGKSKRAGGGRFDVKVLDFGIAKLVAESATKGKTAGLIGTPMWMAPEQTELGPVSPAADVWALGLMLYFALTGRSYWRAANEPDATITQLLKEIVLGDLPLASERARQQGCGGQLPPPLDPVLARAQAREPSKRYPDAGALWDAVEDALSDTRSSARVIAAPAADAFGKTIAAPTEKLGLKQAEIAAVESGKEQPRPSGTYVPPKVVIPPAPAEKALLHAPPVSNGIKIAAGAILVLLVVLAVVGRTMALRARSDTTPGPLSPPPEDTTIITKGPAGGAPAIGAAQASPSPACRLCVTSVKASGPVSDIEVTRAINRELVRLETQCVGRPSARRRTRPTGGTATLSFVVSDARATNRSVSSSSSTDGTDECLVRGLSDVSFPMHKDDTTVVVTLAYDPNR